MEPQKNEGGWKTIFIFNWVIFGIFLGFMLIFQDVIAVDGSEIRRSPVEVGSSSHANMNSSKLREGISNQSQMQQHNDPTISKPKTSILILLFGF